MNTTLYRLLAPVTRFYGPIPHNWFIFSLYAKWLKPRGPWVAPTQDTDLVIECTGGCASQSLKAYIERHNPDIKIASGCHVPAAIYYAERFGIPVVLLTRAKAATVNSMTTRFPVISRRIASLVWDQFAGLLRSSRLVCDYNLVLGDPRRLVKIINVVHGLSLNVGDNNIPNVRVLQPKKRKRAWPPKWMIPEDTTPPSDLM